MATVCESPTLQVIVQDWQQQPQQQINKDPATQGNCCVGPATDLQKQQSKRGGILELLKAFAALYNNPESWGRPDDTVCSLSPCDPPGWALLFQHTAQGSSDWWWWCW